MVQVTELLNNIEQRYGSYKMQYYALNDELAKYEGKLLVDDELKTAHRCMIVMDDIFAEEIQPIGEFVIEKFQEGLKILETHEDLVKKNRPEFKKYTGERPVIEPLAFEEKKDQINISVLREVFDAVKKKYYSYNDDLNRLENISSDGETLQHLLRSFFEMDELFCQELYPMLSFIANHYKEAAQMAKEHYEFKLANVKLEQERLKSNESSIIH